MATETFGSVSSSSDTIYTNGSEGDQIFQSGGLTIYTPSGTTQTVDWNNGNIQAIDLGSATGNVTLTFSNPHITAYTLKVIQDNTAPLNLIYPASVKWVGGIAPVISTGASAIDTITFIYDGTNYLGTFNQAYS
jgi:hypothetical protein